MTPRKNAMSDTLDLMRGILTESLNAEGELGPETPLNELGLDSLDMVNFLFTVEDKTGVQIPDEDIQEKRLSTLGELVAFVDERR